MSQNVQILLIRNVFSNLGDEAMLSCEINELQRSFPNAKLTVLTDDPVLVAKTYGIEADFSDAALKTFYVKESKLLVHNELLRENASKVEKTLIKTLSWLNGKILQPFFCRLFVWNAYRKRNNRPLYGLPNHQRNLVNQIAKADLIIGGGGLIPSIKSIFVPKSALYQALFALGKPLVLHGQTVLPQREAAQTLRSAAQIILRDHRLSRDNAMAMGVLDNNLIFGLDPAFNLPTLPLEFLSEPETEAFLQQPFIAVNLRGWKDFEISPAVTKIAAALSRFYQSHKNVGVLFFGMQNYSDEDDRVMLHKLQAKLPNGVRTILLPRDLRAVALKSVLGKALLVITARYHGAIFALTQAVPTIGLSVSNEYEVKLAGVFEMFKIPQFLLSMRSFTANELETLIKKVVEERSEIVEKLHEQLDKFKTYPSLSDILRQKYPMLENQLQ